MVRAFDSVDEYIAAQPAAVRKTLHRVRDEIRKALPKADETISYNMPTYEIGGRAVLHFAGWKQHFSLYPVKSNLVAALKDVLANYKLDKGTLRIPFSESVPVDLIKRIAKFRAAEVADSTRPQTPKRKPHGLPMTNAETQLASYFAKYEPAMAKLGKALRAKLRARLPGLFEIVYVYENQNALVMSYSPTERGFEAVCSISVYPRVVKLGFGKGAELKKSDPNKLLQGQGKTARYVELNSVADFDRAEVQALIADAVKLAKLRLDPKAEGAMVIKADEQKQRAGRATKAARPASTGRTKASPKQKDTKR